MTKKEDLLKLQKKMDLEMGEQLMADIDKLEIPESKKRRLKEHIENESEHGDGHDHLSNFLTTKLIP